MRVIVAGGGTGGHVIPALAIAQELRSRYDAEVIFIGTSRGIETRLVPAAGFELQLIEVGGLNRVDFATRLKTVLDLPRAVMTSAKVIREFRPDVMVGVGGYASGPAMLAAAMMNIPDSRLRAECGSGIRQSDRGAYGEGSGGALREDLPLLPQLPCDRRSGAARVL